MSNFNLGLPLDIPWRRVCYPDDMQNWNDCDGALPPQWESNVAVSTYEPSGQTTSATCLIPPDPTDPSSVGYVVSYVKLTVTLTPHSPDISGNNKPNSYLDFNAANYLPSTYPCYGALLQVTVRPHDPAVWPNHADWPYFVDAEPKNRELYEAKTDTGETLAGSFNSLSVGKSSTNTQSTEVKFGIAVPIPGGVIGASGDSTSTTSQTNSVQTDSSTERRETQGYTTQLSQMYHLLEAYHVGSNRVMFFMEPRPHVVGVPATFINGPRELEGIQEIFLVVAKKFNPSADTPLCFNVMLDTAHMWTQDQGTPAGATATTKVVSNDYQFSWEGTGSKGGFQWTHGTSTYTAPNGWLVQPPPVFNLHGYLGDANINTDLSSDGKTVTMSPDGNPHWLHYFSDQNATGTLTVTLVPDPNYGPGQFAGMFLTSRNLCCCDGVPGKTPGIKFSKKFPCVNTSVADPTHAVMSTPCYPTGGSGVMTMDNIVMSRKLAKAVRSGIIESVQTASDFPAGPVPFTQSDPYYSQLVDIGRRTNPELTKPIVVSTVVSPQQRDLLTTYMPGSTVESVIKTDSLVISGYTGMAYMDVLQMKDQMLRAAKPVPPPPPVANPMRNVISVRVLSTYPSALSPTVLHEMVNPQLPPTLSSLKLPNVVEVTFSGNPDPGTVNSSSLLVTQGGATLPSTIQQLTLSKYRIILNTPLLASGTYGLTIKGTGGSPITFAGVPLDGTVQGPLPSGNSIAPGDFVSAVNVVAPVPPPPPPPPVTPMLKVTGVQVTTTSGTPHVLADMVVPSSVLQVYASDIPNTIDVEFNGAPDGGTVAGTTFLVTSLAGPVTGTVSSLTSTKFRFVPTSAFVIGSIYNVLLKASGTPAITEGGVPLDGDPIALPSGDGVPGGNFIFSIQVN